MVAERLNVLFITADQWRGDCLSSAGHPVVRTPHLDALAREGVRFARHYANAAPCGPSRACLHTGLYLHNHRSVTNGTPLDARHANWASLSAAAGYDPVLFGYTDTSADPRGLPPGDPRLSTYEGPLPGIRVVCGMDARPSAWTRWLRAKDFDPPADPGQAYGWRRPGTEYEHGAAHPRPLALPVEADDTAFLAGEAMAYMRSAAEPFVAHLSFLRPHPPFVAPAPYNALYDPAHVPGFRRRESGRREGEQHPFLAWWLSRRPFGAPMDERRLRRLKAVYFGLISRVDAEIGRIVAFLRETSLLDRTLIIFTTDHGEQMGDHWLLGKGGYFEASYHVPLIIRDPRRTADRARGDVVDRFTESVDVAPTLLAAIDIPAPEECDGVDLAPFLRGEPAPANWRADAHFEYDFRDICDESAERALNLSPHQCALSVVRSGRYKYVHFTALPPLFFDLAEDPDEFRDLAGDPAYAGIVLAHAQKLLSWRMNHEETSLTHIALTQDGPVSRVSPRYRQ